MFEERACWICLASDGDLIHACNCPEDRVVHRKCLARWQLQSAGRSEEHSCRFCEAVYPSWKESLTPVDLKPAIPVVSVHYNGQCYRMQVRPGPQGLEHFRTQLQSITGMSELDCMQITFQCKAPETAQELNFKGITAFDAAIHCASISAAEREKARSSAKAPNAPAAPSSSDVAASRETAPAAPASVRSNRRRFSADPLCCPPLARESHQAPNAANSSRGTVGAEHLVLSEARAEGPSPAQPGRLRRVHDLLRGLFM